MWSPGPVPSKMVSKSPRLVQKIVGQHPHLQPGLVGLKPLATGLVLTESIPAFLDAVLPLAPALTDL
jgi:hypothetical protein